MEDPPPPQSVRKYLRGEDELKAFYYLNTYLLNYIQYFEQCVQDSDRPLLWNSKLFNVRHFYRIIYYEVLF